MISYFLHLVAVLTFYAGLLSALFLASKLALMHWKSRGKNTAKESPDSKGKLGSIFSLNRLAVISAFAFGFLARDEMLTSRIRTWTDVSVIERHGDEYLVGIGQSEYHLRFCPNKVPDFAPGYVLEKLVAEQQDGCWSVAPRGTEYTIAHR